MLIPKKRPKFSEYQDNIDFPENSKIYCVELDKTFETVEEAAEMMQCERKEAIVLACMHHTMAFGYHWLWD